MRICHVCSAHSVDDGRVFHRACVALAEAGYDVHLIAVGKNDQEYRESKVTLHPLPESSTRKERLARRHRVAELARSLRPDVYHVHEPELLGPVLSRSGGRPVIWDVHESYLDVVMDRDWIPRLMKPWVRLAWDWRERYHVRRCAGVVVATDRLASRYVSLSRLVRVVANYPDFEKMPQPPSAGRNGKTCVFTGTIDPNRGLGQTLQALSLLRLQGLAIPFVIAGRGTPTYIDWLLAEAARLGIADSVSYRGYLSNADIYDLLGRASIGLVPHLPFGNNMAAWPVKMFEFMAFALPVVYSDLPSHQEIARDALIGFAVDSTQPAQIAGAIRQLVENPRKAQEMGRAGKQLISERYNWSRERAKLLALYRELVDPSGRTQSPLGETYKRIHPKAN